MAEVKQTIVKPDPADTSKVYGARRQVNLEAAYPDSPIYDGSISDTERMQYYTGVINDGVAAGGFGVSSFNPQYTGTDPSDPKAPDFTNLDQVPDDNGNMIKIGDGAGAPTTQYIPPLTSPGVGSFDAADQGKWTGNTIPAGREYGSGIQRANPEITSKEIGKQKIGDTLISGRSHKGSDGKAS